MSFTRALASLRKGHPLVLYDSEGREGEADLVYPAARITPAAIARMRQDAGGLICLAIGPELAARLGLPFYSDLVKTSGMGIARLACKKTAYGDVPAFSIPINHRAVFTGITDTDRALTITKFGEMAARKNPEAEFFSSFYAPGHVFLLIGRGLEQRKGHTELSLKLAERAGLPEIMVLCEMLGKGKALSKAKARAYARKKGLIFLEGSEIQ